MNAFDISIFTLDAKITYYNTYCKCTSKYSMPPWCEKGSFCVLNGGNQSQHCPGARSFTIKGQRVDDYLSSHPSVCNGTSRKLNITPIVYRVNKIN